MASSSGDYQVTVGWICARFWLFFSLADHFWLWLARFNFSWFCEFCDHYKVGQLSADHQATTDWHLTEFTDVCGTQNRPTDGQTSGDNQATLVRLVSWWPLVDRSLADSYLITLIVCHIVPDNRPVLVNLTDANVTCPLLYKQMGALCPPYFESRHAASLPVVNESSMVGRQLRTYYPVVPDSCFVARQRKTMPWISQWLGYGRPNWKLWCHRRLFVRYIFNVTAPVSR